MTNIGTQFTTLFWAEFIPLKLKIQQNIYLFSFARYCKGWTTYIDFYDHYQAESNGSLQDFKEQKRKELLKLEEIKVHIQQSLFLHSTYEWGVVCVCVGGGYSLYWPTWGSAQKGYFFRLQVYKRLGISQGKLRYMKGEGNLSCAVVI